MPPLDVLGTTPLLLIGEGDKLRGEVWVSNPSGGDIKVSDAILSVTFPTGVESGPIGLPADAVVPASSVRRLVINMGLQPLTAPAIYAGTLDLTTSAGNQSVAASVLVTTTVAPMLVPPGQVFTGVKASKTIPGSIVVVNKGNVDIVVGQIGDEPVLEMKTGPRVLAVGAGGAVVVEPALGLTSGGAATFTNSTPTIVPGGWASVDFKITTPAALTANTQYRVLPRIATERFTIDLLT